MFHVDQNHNIESLTLEKPWQVNSGQHLLCFLTARISSFPSLQAEITLMGALRIGDGSGKMLLALFEEELNRRKVRAIFVSASTGPIAAPGLSSGYTPVRFFHSQGYRTLEEDDPTQIKEIETNLRKLI